MKKIYILTSMLSLSAFILSGCASSSSSVSKQSPDLMKQAQNLDVKQVCTSSNLNEVIKTAELYNNEAKKRGLEFKRLGMTTTQYIANTKKALASGTDKVEIVDKKKKVTGTVSTQYAAWRACSFSIRALQQAQEAKTTWRLAAPGDGYKY